MKLCKLKLKNINSFRDEVPLDFEDAPLDDTTLVAITGPTGAGKTTLLDAICVALYGKTPRLTGSGTQNPKNLISHGEKECFAEVHFIANNTRYIATWSVKHNRSPQGSLRNAETDELISDKLSSRGKSLGSSENTISDEINFILGLDFEGFQRSIMLAQGEFAAFLKATDEDRRKILETTAGIHIYDILKQNLIDKVNEVSDLYNKKKSEYDLYADTSPEQLVLLNTELNTIKENAKKLDEQLHKIQIDKIQETERKKHHESLESSKKRLEELLNEQPKIEKIKIELKMAERANELRTEKMAYDTSEADQQRSSIASNTAKTELDAAEKHVEKKQSLLTDIDKQLSEITTTHQEKSTIYTQAKSDIQRALERFEEVKKRKPTVEELNTNIDKSSKTLAEKTSRQETLQEQITAAQDFLEQNKLPSDRDARLIRLSSLQESMIVKEEQLTGEITEQSELKSKKSELTQKVRELSEEREKLQKQKTELEVSRDNDHKKYLELQDKGSLDDWQQIRDEATSAQLIVQNYENSSRQLNEKKEDLKEIKNRLTTLDESLDNLESKLENQADICEKVEEKVVELKKERELALLADSVNHLRHQLKDGEPCHVCGATEHPYAEKVESESAEQIKSIDGRLKVVEKDAKKAQNQKRKLEQEQVRLQQDMISTTKQADECDKEIKSLSDEVAKSLNNWQELYEDTDISREWIIDRIEEVDRTIEELNTTRDVYNKTINDLNEVDRKYTICENNYENQSSQLNDTTEELDNLSEEIADLNADIESHKTKFWESMPEPFHTDSTEEALTYLTKTIDQVNSYEHKLSTNEHQSELLKLEISNENDILSDTKHRKSELSKEIEQYRYEGEEILNAVREKTDSLESEDQIDDAITELDAELQVKKDERDAAHQQLLESKDILTQKTTAYQFCEKQLKEDTEKFREASKTYNENLEKLGFDSPEDHNNAFRDTEQIQEFQENIDTYQEEIQSINDAITELKIEFQDSPYEPDKLGQIIENENKTEEKIEEIHKTIGAKQQIIKDLNDSLEKQKVLEGELKTAEQEMDRWKNLREVIPQNRLRDFALDIMFQQVSQIANVQLEFLTSERYQLKVETIGKLSVIDKWNANEERPVETLSGGESFLTSLALALALSELSQGRAQINSLFLDEGFGTLDAETLDIAIAALEGLQMQGRSIYIISHIQELTRRLPVKINVKKKGDGSSTIDIKG